MNAKPSQPPQEAARAFAQLILPYFRSIEIEKADRPAFWATLMTRIYLEMCEQVGTDGAETIMSSVTSLEPLRRAPNLQEIGTKK